MSTRKALIREARTNYCRAQRLTPEEGRAIIENNTFQLWHDENTNTIVVAAPAQGFFNMRRSEAQARYPKQYARIERELVDHKMITLRNEDEYTWDDGSHSSRR